MRRLSRWLMSRAVVSTWKPSWKPFTFTAKPKVESLEDRVVPARPLPFPVLYAGAAIGQPPVVRAFDGDTGAVNFTIQAFERSFTGGVNVASADFNADTFPDLLVGAGWGGGPRVRIFDGKTGLQLDSPVGNFWAYEMRFAGGVNVAAADVTGDGRPDVITAAAADGGPRVRVFDGVTREVVADFWAFEEGFRGGVHLAAGDLTLDGKAEVVVGAGLGGGARVRTFDLSGPEPVLARRFRTDFFAADPAARGGAAVAVGDVNGDTLLDLVTGPSGGTGAARIQVFNGFDGSVMSDFAVLDADTTGVSLGTFYLTDDPYADIVVGSSSGSSNRVQVYNAGTGRLVSGPMADFAPLAAEANGVRIAAANDPGPYMSYGTVSFAPGSIAVGQTFEVSCLVSGYFAPGTPQITGTVTFSAQQVTPTFSKLTIPLGSASLVPATGGMMISRGLATLAVANQSLKAGASYQIKAFYSGDSVYSSGGTMVASLQVIGSPIAPIPDCECQSTGSGEATPAGAGLMAPIPKTAGGTRIADGAVTITRNDFAAADVGGSGWTQAWQWTNAGGYQQSEAGSGATLSQAPHLMQVNGNSSLAIVPAAGTAHVLDSFAGAYHPRHNEKTALTAAGGQFTFTDGRGNATVFYDFSGGTPTGRAGRMISSTTADGTTTTVTSWDGSGRPTEMQRVTGSGGTAVTESLVTTYVTSGANAGLVADATLRRKVGTGSWETVRVAEYTYYVNADNHGRDKHLKLAVVKDGAGTTLDTDYYRYDVAASGTDKPLAFAFGTAAYARLTAALGTSVDSLTDAQVDDYADHSLELDSSKRVTKHVVAGAGCSACTGGQGEYTYSYGSNVVAGEAIVGGSNVWQTKVTETLPDGNTNTYYTNGTGQLMLRVYEEVATGAKWRWYTRYDAAGRAILSAGPSTVTGHDEQYADLVNDQGGNFQYLDDDDGLVAVNEFAAATTATSSTAGDVDGYRKGQSIRHGELGTNVPQSASTYIKRTAGSQDYFHPATTTQYRNDDGTGGQTTSWSYTWQGTTAEIESVTTTMPTVTTAQNGPNTATSTVTVNDSFGRPVWSKDEAGFLSYTEYDTKTGAVTKTIADVEDANTGDFTGLPSGWTTPSGGGLHLITTYEVDHLGRTTKMTAPNGRVDYTVYDDDNHEVRSYPGWNSGTNLPTGPIAVSRDDRAGGYTETLTMSATPSVSSGRPTGAESIGSVESLSRSYRNLAGQVTHTDSYFNLTGVTYSTVANLGTLNTNYYRTTTDYGKQAGQVNKQVSAAGTITRTEHDGQGRATSIWVGTDDTPTTGFWSTTNLTGTNMTKVAEYEYDNGGVGDGNVTKVTQFPGGGAADRVTQTFYDWRNRSVVVKSGVEGSESTSVNRPIQYLDYDNLNQVVTTRLFDGDTVSISYTADVPDAPSSSLLRAKSTTSFDELGRAYLSEVYSVDPSIGSVGSYTLASNTWFDKRGHVLKTSAPGGLVQKMTTDGAGRVTASYTTDGGGDSGYSDADDVTGDTVLSQDEMTYDENGLVLVATHRDRFHDATDTGALGNPSSTSGTAKARVSYMGYYYDTGDRLTDSVDVGTNGGSAWSRPGSVPSRSDTVLVTGTTFDSAGLVYETTDPKGIVARTLYDDLGRTTKTIEHYVDGTVGDDNDKTTEYTYGPAGMTSLAAKLTGGGGQTTEWVYGVTSGIYSNDIVAETRWPDASSGSASSSEDEDVTVNALGETLTSEDRNGNVHTFGYDVLGRMTDDAVTTLGTNVDGAVRRISTAYDGQGNAQGSRALIA